MQTCWVSCAQGGNYSSCFLLPHCLCGQRLCWSPLTQQPGAGGAPAWSLPGTVPSLSPCPQLLFPLANRVLGVGVEVNGDVCSGRLLSQVWGGCGSDGDQDTCVMGFGGSPSKPWSPQPYMWSVCMCPVLADTGPASKILVTL